MPYISPKHRKDLATALNNFLKSLEKSGYNADNPEIDGVLNYLISKILLTTYHKKPSYRHYNRMMGVVECVKQELYRRAVVPYEDKKIKENGDIL